MNNLIDFINEKLKINSKSKIIIKDKENWTINDAEDGDIIVWNGVLYFIYKGLNGEYKINNTNSNTIVYHAYYIPDNRKKLEVITDTGVGDTSKPQLFKLATDEQCEEFYKALEDHGYKWDDNKKEIIEL